jgi:hypothetical protein
MSQNRRAISPGRLYTLLATAFKERKSKDCLACRMPLPYLISRPDEVSANWRLGHPPPCMHGCDTLIAEIAAAAWPLYDMHDPAAMPHLVPEDSVAQAETKGESSMDRWEPADAPAMALEDSPKEDVLPRDPFSAPVHES